MFAISDLIAERADFFQGYPTESEIKPYLNDQECFFVADSIEMQWPHLKRNSGCYVMDDGSPGDHAWNRHPDGTIIDATAIQFGSSDYIIDRQSDQYDRYVSWQHENIKAQALGHKAGWHDPQEDYDGLCPQCTEDISSTRSLGTN